MTRRPLALLLGLFLPLAAQAASVPLDIQTKGAAAYAKDGSAGYGSYAVVTFVVTRASSGLPEWNLGTTVGDGTPLPALPPGFTMRDLWIQPDPIPDNCVPVPVYFRNSGNGAYAVHLAPGRDPNCAWTSGDHHFLLQFQRVVGSDTLAGSGLVELRVP